VIDLLTRRIVCKITVRRAYGPRLYWTWGHSVFCEEKTRLGTEYDATTSRFSEAVRELHQRMGTSLKDEYDRLERASNEARVRSEQARLALEQHVAAHGC
jgi:hypothetical protein